MKAYSGAAGWRDNDASFHVVAKTRKKVMDEIDAFIEREAEEAVESDELFDSVDDAIGNMWYVGPFESTLESELNELFDWERKEAESDFRDLGVFYPQGA